MRKEKISKKSLIYGNKIREVEGVWLDFRRKCKNDDFLKM